MRCRHRLEDNPQITQNMKNLAVTLIAVLLYSCSFNGTNKSGNNIPGPSSGNKEITIMTYNVGVFSKYRDSMDDIAKLILERGASLVSMNELDSCNRRHDVYQLELLAKAIGYEFYFASAFPYAGGAYGNGVVSAKPILSRQRIDLPKLEGKEARSVAVVETAECVFASVHLDVKASRLEQVAIVNDWFTSRYTGYSKPVFLCGDMNDLPESDTIKELEKCWCRISPIAPTFPKSSKCIDYIFTLKAAPSVEVVSAGVISEGTSDLSDHYPIVMTVRP